jgi:phosphinothricin acetyltransferase
MNSSTKKSTIIIREAAAEDAPALAEIYRYYVEETAVSFEYEAPDAEEFAGRMRDIRKRYPYFVAEEDGELLGYAYGHAFIDRAAYDWAAETTIYLRNDQKGRGIGRALYQALEKALTLQGVLDLYACIGVTEQEDEYLTNNSICFHRHLGFADAGLFPKSGSKFGRWYDMVWVLKSIGPHRGDPAPLKSFDEVRAEFGERMRKSAESTVISDIIIK